MPRKVIAAASMLLHVTVFINLAVKQNMKRNPGNVWYGYAKCCAVTVVLSATIRALPLLVNRTDFFHPLAQFNLIDTVFDLL